MVVKNNEQGQAIFEMLVFLPLFIFMFTIIFNVGSAINVSINQQKATRRYFYYLAKGNSYLPRASNLDLFRQRGGADIVGMSFIGYRERFEGDGDRSFGSCLKFSAFITGEEGEECDDAIDDSEEVPITRFIKVFTGYGICGETFRLLESPTRHYEAAFSSGAGEADPRSQLIGCSNI